MDVSTEHLKFADVYPDLAKKYAQKLHIKKDEIPFIRKFYSSEKSEPVKEERAVISYITTNLKDRDGEVLLPEGMITENYEKSGRPVFWGHSYGDPKNVVGQNMWLKPDKDGTGIIAKTAFRKNQFADEVYQLFTEDIAGIGPALKSWSVGFIPIKWADGDTKDVDAPKRTYQQWELLEYSAVPIGSNPGAISLAYQKGMITTKRLKEDLETELEIEIEDFQEEVEIENEVQTMTPEELKEHYRGLREVELVSDMEDADEENEIIPVSTVAEIEDEEESDLQDTVNELIEEGVDDVEDLAFDEDIKIEPPEEDPEESDDVAGIKELIYEVKEQYESVLSDKDEIIAELKEGRVLSRKNREVVKNAVDALMNVLKADSTGSREDDDKVEVEDEKEVEVVVEKSEYSAEELQVMMDGALKKALANIDIGKAVDRSVKKLKGVVE